MKNKDSKLPLGIKILIFKSSRNKSSFYRINFRGLEISDIFKNNSSFY